MAASSKHVAALNHVALLRAQLMGGNYENDVPRFIADMRDMTDNNFQDNRRALSAIFFLANISKDRHSTNFADLTSEDYAHQQRQYHDPGMADAADARHHYRC
ncbi:DUF5347 family protein [Pantoea sp.]|uniref:DUF5347 family protein n=1 Tax=Pantoea sp. TaxID=69393 RepID=UPI0028A98CF6|nr:DUF5347 family protein [Pantoea sp.]